MLEICSFKEFDKLAIKKGWKKISDSDSSRNSFTNTPVYRKGKEEIHLEGNFWTVSIIEITDERAQNTIKTLTLKEFKKEK